MSKNYENPNCAAFFFEDGTFVNLERVGFVRKSSALAWGFDDTTEPTEWQHHLVIGGFNGGFERPFVEAEFKAISDALRIYHSKL